MARSRSGRSITVDQYISRNLSAGSTLVTRCIVVGAQPVRQSLFKRSTVITDMVKTQADPVTERFVGRFLFVNGVLAAGVEFVTDEVCEVYVEVPAHVSAHWVRDQIVALLKNELGREDWDDCEVRDHGRRALEPDLVDLMDQVPPGGYAYIPEDSDDFRLRFPVRPTRVNYDPISD